MTLTKAEVEEIAERAAKGALRDMMALIGVDVDDPFKAQEDFALLRLVGRHVKDAEFRKDIEFTRELRLGVKTLRMTSVRAVIGVVITATLGALWLGFQTLLSRGH